MVLLVLRTVWRGHAAFPGDATGRERRRQATIANRCRHCGNAGSPLESSPYCSGLAPAVRRGRAQRRQ
ncbi:hypothetical protein TI01_0867 [Lysobacter sp. A03]|nr:hypothetical protein TI01_0867 [Lysobacter sp. A03]